MIFRLASLGFPVVLAFICLLSTGCGEDSGVAAVSGTVISEGKRVPNGRVVFKSGSTTCVGVISGGEYQLKNKGKTKIPLGDYAVTVCPPADMIKFNPATGEDEMTMSRADLALFPEKYRKTSTSDLKFSPEVGENVYDITLGN